MGTWISGPSPVTVDNTGGGKSLATLLGTALSASVTKLLLVPRDGGVVYMTRSGAASASSGKIPPGGIELSTNKGEADDARLFAASNVTLDVWQGA